MLSRRQFVKWIGMASAGAAALDGAVALAQQAIEDRDTADPNRELPGEWCRISDILIGSPARTRMPSRTHWIFSSYWPTLGKFVRSNADKDLENDPAYRDSWDKVTEQVENLAALLAAQGIAVSRPRLPTEEEMRMSNGGDFSGFSHLFARDAAIAVGGFIIDACHRIPFRRKALWTQRTVLDAHCRTTGWRHIGMPAPTLAGDQKNESEPYLEGGDVFVLDRDILVGHSGLASSHAGIEWLRRLLAPEDFHIHPIELAQGGSGAWLHLDGVFATPRRGLAVVVPKAITGGVRALPAFMQDWDIVEATESEALAMACNTFNLDNNLTVVGSEHDRLINELDKKHVEIVTLPFDAPSAWGRGLRGAACPLPSASR